MPVPGVNAFGTMTSVCTVTWMAMESLVTHPFCVTALTLYSVFTYGDTVGFEIAVSLIDRAGVQEKKRQLVCVGIGNGCPGAMVTESPRYMVAAGYTLTWKARVSWQPYWLVPVSVYTTSVMGCTQGIFAVESLR